MRATWPPSHYQFRPRPGTCDENVFNSIVQLNEYHLPADFGGGEANIIDIGGHVGSFTRACLDRGATQVMAFEPDFRNFHMLCDHLRLRIDPMGARAFADPVMAFNAAVWRSDIEGGQPISLVHGGYAFDPEAGEVNTGGGNVWEGTPTDESEVSVYHLSLLSVLEKFEGRPIRLIKLDCEGSEWPVLYSLPNPRESLASVQAIIGEYHIAADGGGDSEWEWEKNTEGLARFFTQAGFPHVYFKRGPGENWLGWFWAERTPVMQALAIGSAPSPGRSCPTCKDRQGVWQADNLEWYCCYCGYRWDVDASKKR